MQSLQQQVDLRRMQGLRPCLHPSATPHLPRLWMRRDLGKVLEVLESHPMMTCHVEPIISHLATKQRTINLLVSRANEASSTEQVGDIKA